MRITGLFFSPTGNTKSIVSFLVDTIYDNRLEMLGTENLNGSRYLDITLPSSREDIPFFEPDEVLVIGFPVYAGRVPNLMLSYLSSLKAEGTLCVPLVCYGNRAFDDSLVELCDIMTENGFRVVAAAALVGQHSFSETLAKGRPDIDDFQEIRNFVSHISFEGKSDLAVPGRSKEDRAYYKPLSPSGESINILKVQPRTLDTCTGCGECSRYCPLGSISKLDSKQMIGKCMKCNSCIKACPVGAKVFDDPGYLIHKEDLESTLTQRKNNYFYY